MNRDTLVHRVALAFADAKNPYAGPEPSNVDYEDAARVVAIVEKATLDNRRARVIAYLEESQRQAEGLYADTGHPMWLGKVIAFSEIIDAVKYGVLGEEYDGR